jgi:hypothetical protein
MKSHDKGNGKESKPANPAPTNSERQVGILAFYFLKFNFGFGSGFRKDRMISSVLLSFSMCIKLEFNFGFWVSAKKFKYWMKSKILIFMYQSGKKSKVYVYMYVYLCISASVK